MYHAAYTVPERGDEPADGDSISTSTGWLGWSLWVDDRADEYPTCAHLAEEGWIELPNPDLESELGAVADAVDDPDLAGVTASILAAVHAAPDGASALIVTDGEGGGDDGGEGEAEAGQPDDGGEDGDEDDDGPQPTGGMTVTKAMESPGMTTAQVVAALPAEALGHPALRDAESWADDYAAQHAEAVADHLGIDVAAAHFVLREKIIAIADAASVATPPPDPRRALALEITNKYSDAMHTGTALQWLEASELCAALAVLPEDDLDSAANFLVNGTDASWERVAEFALGERAAEYLDDVTPDDAAVAYAYLLANGEYDAADEVRRQLPPSDPFASLGAGGGGGGGGSYGRRGASPSAPAVTQSGVPSIPRPTNEAGAGSLPGKLKAWDATGRRIPTKPGAVVKTGARVCDLLRCGCK
jgi:hypothetical protein